MPRNHIAFPSPLDYPNDSLGWTNAVIAHARAVSEASEVDDLTDENADLVAENDELRRLVAYQSTEQGKHAAIERQSSARRRFRRGH